MRRIERSPRREGEGLAVPRDLPLGNGHMLVAFDLDYRLCDVFFPRVGLENQTDGKVCRFGLWRGGRFAWFPEDGFTGLERDYDGDTLVTRVRASVPALGLSVELSDAVDFHENVLVRRLFVDELPSGPEEGPRPAGEVRAFWHHVLSLRGTGVGDCAFYDPDLRAVVHYKGARYLLAGGQAPGQDGIDHFAVGVTGIHGMEGTWRDAEDGVLGLNPVAQGSVDSVISLRLGPGEEAWTWLCLGRSLAEVGQLQKLVREKTPAELWRRTANYWRVWRGAAPPENGGLDESVWRLYRRSLLVARTQIDDGGAVLAAGDWEIARQGHDTYTYVWARDAAFTVDALGRAGFGHIAARFFRFCAETITAGGYLEHKYNPDGTPGSTWHPRVLGRRSVLPIQEDETALVVWAMWRAFCRNRSVDDVRPYYRPLVIRAADFMERYRDPSTGLPLPSYDLWEERRGVSAFTAATVHAGLLAAAGFAAAFGEESLARRYRDAAASVRRGAHAHLYSPEAGRIARMALVDPVTDRLVGLDLAADASLFTLDAFGLFDTDDPRLEATLEHAARRLWVPGPVGGVARYEHDLYQRPAGVADVPGNPWFICTLWRAEWEMRRAESRAGLGTARDLLAWVVRHALPSGVLAEQIHPTDHSPLSVSPLTWSHAALVAAVETYRERWLALA